MLASVGQYFIRRCRRICDIVSLTHIAVSGDSSTDKVAGPSKTWYRLDRKLSIDNFRSNFRSHLYHVLSSETASSQDPAATHTQFGYVTRLLWIFHRAKAPSGHCLAAAICRILR